MRYPGHIGPMPAALLGEPLQFIAADHERQRSLCVLLDSIADTEVVQANAVADAVAYMGHDMQTHIIDEEEDLFPLLRRRARPNDEIDEVLGRLAADHATDARLAEVIMRGLRAWQDHPKPVMSTGLRENLRAFAEGQRQHLALENAVILPMARLRLTAPDLASLAARMAARRGLALELRVVHA